MERMELHSFTAEIGQNMRVVALKEESVNEPVSVLWCKAMNDDAEAQNSLGIAYLEGKDISKSYESSFYWFKRACKLGSLFSLSNLAFMYLEGLHVQQNFAVVKELLEEAVSRGCPYAENNLGIVNLFGFCEEPDPTLAKVNFQMAALRGVSEANFNLNLIQHAQTA